MSLTYSPSATKRWTTADVDTEALSKVMDRGYTLDELDTISADTDALPYSLDARYYSGQSADPTAIDSTHKLATFTGTALTATIETGEVALSPGKRTTVTNVRPVAVGSGAITMQVGTRNFPGDSTTWTGEIPVNAVGTCNFRANAYHHRFRLKVTNGFTDAQGVDVLKAMGGGSR